MVNRGFSLGPELDMTKGVSNRYVYIMDNPFIVFAMFGTLSLSF
jgi:hypothetical protein